MSRLADVPDGGCITAHEENFEDAGNLEAPPVFEMSIDTVSARVVDRGRDGGEGGDAGGGESRHRRMITSVAASAVQALATPSTAGRSGL